MPRNKDQKRVIRARMKKTGESYTAARAVVVSRKSDPRYAAPRKEWAALTGVRDDVVKAKTGRTWAEWVAVLDRAGAHELSHRDIARHVSSAYDGVDSWWAQSVTVGYERIRGLRDVGQHRDGAYEANKSRTFPASAAALYSMFHDARRRKKWLPDGWKKLRGAVADKSMRADWHDGTRVTVYFTPKGPAKTTVTVQHAKLPSRADMEKSKAFWNERLGALGDVLRER